jgi:DNA-binding winged helix-turn-helix (wHTH) protein
MGEIAVHNDVSSDDPGDRSDAAGAAGLRFGILGPLTVWRNGSAVRVGAAKHQQLLAVLLLSANERVARSTIIESIWGQTPVRSADNLVQKYVGELRRAFDPHRTLLRSATIGYQLRLDSAHLDSLVFGQCLDHARTARSQGDLTRAERWLRDAVALWRVRPWMGSNWIWSPRNGPAARPAGERAGGPHRTAAGPWRTRVRRERAVAAGRRASVVDRCLTRPSRLVPV